jgi:HSP20 family protein
MRTLIKSPNYFPVMNAFFDDFNTGDLSLAMVNLKESDKGYEIEVAVPGKKKDDFTIKLENNLLTISTEEKMEREEKDEKQTFLVQESGCQSFFRSFVLSDAVKNESFYATYKNGILNIKFPKKVGGPRWLPKTISVR